MVDKLEQRMFLLLLAVVTALFLFLLKPFFAPILWACIVAVLFQPVSPGAKVTEIRGTAYRC